MGLWTMENLITFLLVNRRASISGLSILDKSQPAWQDCNSSHGCKGLAEGLRQQKRSVAFKMVELHVQGYFKHVCLVLFSTIQGLWVGTYWNTHKHDCFSPISICPRLVVVPYRKEVDDGQLEPTYMGMSVGNSCDKMYILLLWSNCKQRIKLYISN
jgi:hypothetical protein